MATLKITEAHYLGAVINAAAGATAVSDVYELYENDGMSVQFDYGVVTGTLVLKGSNDGVTFYAVADVAFTAPAGAPGGELLEIGNLRSRCYRFDWTNSSGTGAVKVSVHVKGRG